MTNTSSIYDVSETDNVLPAFILNRGYQMSVGLILNLLNYLIKVLFCEPLTSIKLFYSPSSINLVLNLYEFNILFVTYPQKRIYPYPANTESD